MLLFVGLLLVLLLAGGVLWRQAERRARHASLSRKVAAFDREIESFDRSMRPGGADAGRLVVTLRRLVKDGAVHAFVGDEDLGELTTGRESVIRDAAEVWLRTTERAPTSGGPSAVVDAPPDVPTHHVIRAVDSLIAAGVKDVTFSGAPPLGSQLEEILGKRR